MENPQTKSTELNLGTVKDNLPFILIWRQVLKELWGAMGIVSTIVFIFAFFMLVFVGLIFHSASNSDLSMTVMLIIFGFSFLMVFGLGLTYSIAKKTRTLLRASACAQANGFSFAKGLKDPGYAGLIFSAGDTRKSASIIEGNYQGREFKLFNYSYMEGSGKSRHEYNKGVIMIKLPRKLPNVIFDSKSNNFLGISSLGTAFSRSQKFTFEGDFNNHFDVYAPKTYGRDVLYFMTPELMALLVDEAGNFDIEVVDDYLFFYAPEFDFKTQQLKSIFKIIQNLGGEFSENTQRYADERVGNKELNIVAEPGKRLKKTVPWITIVIIAIYIILRILAMIADNQ